MQELVEFIAKSLVDDPSQVEIGRIERDRMTVFALRVAPGDFGKVIGRQGRTARAIRSILAAASARSGRRYSLDIVE